MTEEAKLEKAAALSQLLGTGKFTLGGINKWLVKEGEAPVERLGTPYTDGFLMYCIEQGFNGEKVAELIEKASEVEGRPGQECKQFLEKVLAQK